MHKFLFYDVYYMPLHVSSITAHHQEVKIVLYTCAPDGHLQV